MVKEAFIALIDKYLSGTATASEQRLVEEYLARFEENDSIIFANGQDRQVKEAMWQHIQLQTIPQSVQVVQMPWYKKKVVRLIAVAASVILILGLGTLLSKNNTSNLQSAAVQKDKPTDSSQLSLVHHEINTTGKDKRIQLPDGSLIVLADKSEISYRQPLILRDITLTGKGVFKVAKDKTRPFTVISGDISTTALGTEFSVTTFKTANQVIVRLYEGRVVVKAVDKGNKKMKKDVYLSPGQEFVYHGQALAKVRAFKVKNTAGNSNIREHINRDDPSLPKRFGTSWYMFNNQPLDIVLSQLKEMYDVEIQYSKKDVQKLYFIGQFNKTDSIETILNQIAISNNLKLTKKNDTYILKK